MSRSVLRRGEDVFTRQRLKDKEAEPGVTSKSCICIPISRPPQGDCRFLLCGQNRGAKAAWGTVA
ncbi:hypothetical protein E2C01_075367 [Portunus trituberculatus]|uniref:Uncharacterized protein n=1 Tax=Portunus trituberculatus TaxID=210409 RepID=A0A5B7IFN4_PORTR|nr:hypothetical protein [Portunus trituberculatus]